jgi:hypothetical protein
MGGVKGKAHGAISLVPTPSTPPSASLGASAKQGRLLRKRTRKDGAPSALFTIAQKAEWPLPADGRGRPSLHKHAAGGRRFIFRTLIWGTRGVKGEAHCAISVVPTLAQRNAQEWGTPGAGCARE